MTKTEFIEDAKSKGFWIDKCFSLNEKNYTVFGADNNQPDALNFIDEHREFLEQYFTVCSNNGTRLNLLEVKGSKRPKFLDQQTNIPKKFTAARKRWDKIRRLSHV